MKTVIALLLLVSIGAIGEAHGIQSCQCVAFRMDDIQDYWLDTVQVGVIGEFEHKNADLTIGIIGNYFGQDQKVVGTVSGAIKQASPKVAVANHGWNHEYFNKFSRDEQSALIHNTNQKISDVLGIIPNIFIAPYDAFDNDTLIALLDNNMVYMSSNDTRDGPPYSLSGASFYRFPAAASIGALNKENTAWISLNHNQTYSKVLRSMIKYGFAVVVLHPQDFANKHRGPVYDNALNQTQIRELDLLIDKIQSDGYKIVTMDDIPKNANHETASPQWLEQDFAWLSRGNITSSEVINLVEYLKAKSVITSSNAGAKYPVHDNIRTTYFWVGEAPDSDNKYIDNLSSAWDDTWVGHYGGVDDPVNRDQYLPSQFVPKENPFYFALPYNDFRDDGTRQADAYEKVYWSGQKSWGDSESMLKNRWIEITKGDRTAYAQWEDVGPFVSDDSGYVFGDAQPENKSNRNAGLDVSPAVRDYIDLQHGKNLVSWKFVDDDQVPDGPWKKIVTTSGVFHAQN